MTYAPDDLKQIQAYAHTITGLPWASLGITHSTPQGGGYHEGNDLLAQAGQLNSDYSKKESPRDRPGSNGASAFDFGDFSVVYLGRQINHRDLVNAVLAEVKLPGKGRCKDLREMIYQRQEGSSTILRWDALGVRSSGDSSHQTHTHFSFFRDSEGRRANTDNFLGLMRRTYEMTFAPVIKPSDEEDDMGANSDPITIQVEGSTSLTTIVDSGLADPRKHWLRVTNDTLGEDYVLRIWWGNGKGGWAALTLGGDAKGVTVLGDGIYQIKSNWTLSGIVPKGCEVITIGRMPVKDGPAPYRGHLTCMFERSAVSK